MGYRWPQKCPRVAECRSSGWWFYRPTPLLGVDSLPPEIRPAGKDDHRPEVWSNLVGISIEQAERELIRNTLKLVEGNREQAAKILGIGERTLYRKIKEYDL